MKDAWLRRELILSVNEQLPGQDAWLRREHTSCANGLELVHDACNLREKELLRPFADLRGSVVKTA